MLEIEENTVTGVLLNDGWHYVLNKTFKIDQAAFKSSASGGTSFGETARWQDDVPAKANPVITAPLTSILAIRTKR